MIDCLIAYVGRLAQGLACLHAAGVVHRDIKTANLFLSASDDIKLGNFGCVPVLLCVLLLTIKRRQVSRGCSMPTRRG